MKKVLNKLKHLFIPHEHNEYKPHFFREYSIGIISVISIFLFIGSYGAHNYIKNTNMTAAVLPAVLVDLANEDRTENNKAPLVRSSVLDEAARLKAEDMAAIGYFAHTSPSGVTPWHWLSQVNYRFIYAGENLAVDFTESTDVEDAWLKSPKHRQNIMDDRFTEIGIATKDGIYEGEPTIFVVQMFGKPALSTPDSQNVNKLKTERLKENIKPRTLATADLGNGGVLGETVTSVQKVEVISEDKDFIGAKSTDAENPDLTTDLGSEKPAPVSYSTNKEKLIFNSSRYLNIFYQVILYIVMLALILMIVIEARRQHPKNIAYGLCVIVLVLALSYINKAVFVSPFLF